MCLSDRNGFGQRAQLSPLTGIARPVPGVWCHTSAKPMRVISLALKISRMNDRQIALVGQANSGTQEKSTVPPADSLEHTPTELALGNTK
jgi:hypothetical protein